MRKYRLQTPATSPGSSRLDYAAELNGAQQAVVTRGGGAALVIAGAGSGKTRTITYRVAWLLEHGVDPGSILLMTFTNKAAREMLSRVDSLTGSNASRTIVGGTFHRVANRQLRRHAASMGFSPDFTILDPEDRQDLMRAVLGECAARWRGGPAGVGAGPFHGKDPLTERRFPSAQVLCSVVSAAVNRQKNLSDLLVEQHPYFAHLAPLVGEVAVAFAGRKRDRNLMDFDDLLLYWKRLLDLDPGARAEHQARFRHVLVDEYQDTNRLQADVIDRIAGREDGHGGEEQPSRSLIVVGDDCQSIYSFRGANFANIMEFPDRYPGCAVHRLETNYRSTPQILALANRVIEVNRRQFPKVLQASRPAGEKPALIPTRDVHQQCEFVAQRILELRDEGVPLAEIAVLYRSHSHSLELQVELARRGIPYQVRSGLRFFERAHVKDVLAHLRIVSNPRDEISWNRVVRLYPRIGSATADRIGQYLAGAGDSSAHSRSTWAERMSDDARADQAVPAGSRSSWKRIRDLWLGLSRPGIAERPEALIEAVLAADYTELLQAKFGDAATRIEDLQQLAAYAAGFPDTASFLADITMIGEILGRDDGSADGEDEQVSLSTVHRAKGLEWRAVFVIWAADGYFPSVFGLRDPEGEEEERRLFYVAVTRAKDELYFCHPSTNPRKDGRVALIRPSRFLADLDGPHPYERWMLEEGAASADVPAALPAPDGPEEVE